MLLWLQLLLCLVLIGAAGFHLSRWAHAASAFSAMMMSGMVTVGLTLRPKSRVLRTVSWVSLFMMAVYLLNTLFPYLYLHGG
jgi:hypothetical protein